MKQCERCLKLTDGVHTCTPTKLVRRLEGELKAFKHDSMGRHKVLWATTAGDYLPFTSLPKEYHGRYVGIYIIKDEE